MSSIKLLDTNTINQIAAGEVIDRPASIIKELVENSIDAGATTVSIEIKGGGIDLIRITDNGIGIPAEEVPVAFLRHATSKINNAADLPLVTSLGFRGEALASIAAVADVMLITKQKDAVVGTQYHIKGGVELSNNETGAPDGTTFIISDVFGNVPVRKKFLKTASTEAAYCTEIVERIALSHPEVSFKFKNNGRDYFFTNGNTKLKEMIFGIYGREIANEMLEVDGYDHGIHVYGAIARPVVVRSNRNTENFFVNGRYIRSAIVSKGIENAYQPFLMQHKYPFTCLYIDIDPLLMDVNVHPSKQEVRFENPEAVYIAIFNICSEALKEKAHIHRFEAESSNTKKSTPIDSYKRPEPAKTSVSANANTSNNFVDVEKQKYINTTSNIDKNNRIGVNSTDVSRKQADNKTTICDTQSSNEINIVNTQSTSAKNNNSCNNNTSNSDIANNFINTKISSDEVKVTENKESTENKVVTEIIDISANSTLKDTSASTESSAAIQKVSIVNEENSNYNAALPEPFETKRMEQLSFDLSIEDSGKEHVSTKKEFETCFSKGYRIVGQVFNTYWIIECQGCMYMIDQHAAHEKIIYEKMMRELEVSAESQLISPPLIITLSSTEAAAVEQYSDDLEKCGFIIENFGGKEYALTAIPLNLYGLDAKNLLLEILTELSTLPTGSVLLSIKEKIATCSCKAAIKGGNALSELEAKALINQLLEAENPFNCPHGRPIIIDYSKYEIEKKFKRVL